MKEEKDNRIKNILGGLDGIRKVEAPDFFYTRLLARMKKNDDTVMKRKWILRPVYAVTVMGVLLLFNIAIMFQNRGNETTSVNDEIENLRTIASAYHINDNLLYDINQ